jgi:tRNA threonylcarbamoyladenosine biosynthesis protein TsaE
MHCLNSTQTEQAVEYNVTLKSAEQTTALARAFAPFLSGGNTVLLQGSVGAGKTHFARQLILSRLADINMSEDVPSPTFTLVQTYDVGGVEIWHADLYRLSDPSEIYELGLEAAFETEICLVEWPDRLAELVPQDALSICLETIDENSRSATLQWTARFWNPIVKHALQAIQYDKP